MGKLLCDSTAVAEPFQGSPAAVALPWIDSKSPSPMEAIGAVDLIVPANVAADAFSGGWEDVVGLEEQQRRHLQRLHAKGVLWKPPEKENSSSSSPSSSDLRSVVFRLSHGGEVSSDGNCLFTASRKAMGCEEIDPKELRRRTVARFLEDFRSVSFEEREAIDDAIRHMYSPDLKNGWGIHVVQEVKLLAKKEDRFSLDSAIDELVHLGMQREMAAESIYKERCIPVNDGSTWAKYMLISGSPDDEYDIITLQYTEEGLLSVDDNREGRAAAFGDDIAIECLATEFKREIFVVQAHGSDAMVDEENCVFFLPHRPRSQIMELPFFLFMKGTATLFGQLWRLEPLCTKKKAMWRREMEWLLSVSDHIVELTPNWQTFPDGSKLEIMTCRPRSDLYVNLPALRKLDNMILEILDSFVDTDFWYVDQGVIAPEAGSPSSYRQALQRQEEKWWLPVPRVPPHGLNENSRKQLQHKRDCTSQILKAAMAINSITLAEMDIPDSFLESLPKNARISLGDVIHRYITSDHFSPECLLGCLDLSSEHQAIEIADRAEASMYIWRKRTNSKPASVSGRTSSRTSWEMVKDLMVDADKRELFAERAESLLHSLKQRFPGLPQSALDMSKIQYNKDVGKAILEGYSRVLESLAFNMVSRIDDVLYVDDLTKHSDQFTSLSKVGAMTHKNISVPFSMPAPTTPYKSAFATPTRSPAHPISSATGGKSPLINGNNTPRRRAKKSLTDFLSIDSKGKECGSSKEREVSESKAVEVAAFETDVDSSDGSPNILDKA